MQKVQQIVPISDMRNAQDAVLAKMDQAPVILAARSKPRAVLVNVDEWNRIATELERLQMVNQAMKARVENQPGRDLEAVIKDACKRHDLDASRFLEPEELRMAA